MKNIFDKRDRFPENTANEFLATSIGGATITKGQSHHLRLFDIFLNKSPTPQALTGTELYLVCLHSVNNSAIILTTC